MVENRKIFTLQTILNRVQQVFDELMLGKYFWIKVEVLKVNKDRRGHYYLELVEQVEDKVLARCRATIWSRNVERCLIDGGEELDKVVREGADILCYCEAIFHPVYGFSLHVIHVDYAFSIGEIERKKQLTIRQLQQRGLLQLNKEKTHPIVIQKIAVVASIGTSGYEDFVQHLQQNPYHFSFTLHCFDTPVQGELAVQSIVQQLDIISKREYDAVVILRGGGSKFDLDVFNLLAIAEKIAQMPGAVFTGIGHETDNTVADYVAHSYFKTPSAVAAFIIELAFQFDVFLSQGARIVQEQGFRLLEKREAKLHQLEERVGNLSHARLRASQGHLETQTTTLMYVVQQLTQRAIHDLHFKGQAIETEGSALLLRKENTLSDKTTRLSLWGKQSLGLEQQKVNLLQELIVARVRHKLAKEKIQLTQTEELVSLYDMEEILRKGFAVIRYKGKVLDAHTLLRKGDELELTLYNRKYRIKLESIEEIKQWKNLHTNKQQLN